MNRGILRFVLSISLPALWLGAANAAAQSYKAERANEPAPVQLSSTIRATLAPEALRVSGSSGPLCEIWLRQPIPAQATPNPGLGIAFGQLVDGSLFGAARFDSAAKDYRDKPIQPGVYTLRYALQPVDGNHQGVSPYRDFLLLAPAAADTSPANLPDKELYALSLQASNVGHPSVWSLVPADSAPASLPAVVHQSDEDLWVLYFKAPLEPAGGAATSTTIGLVVSGHAEEQ